MKNVETKKSKTGGDRTEPGAVDFVSDRRLDLPECLREKSAHEIWGAGGLGPLIRRLEEEYKLGRSALLPLTRAELATLVELYEDEPSLALREVVVRELRNQRRIRPGPKVSLGPSQWLERHLLPIYYERAMRVAGWLRKRLIATEKRKRRWEKPEYIPTQAALAMRFVRHWLPSIRNLDDKTIANKLSEMKDPSEKKRRAKSAKR